MNKTELIAAVATKTGLTRKDAEKRGIPLVYTAEGTVRLRTDGNIWVLDMLPTRVHNK